MDQPYRNELMETDFTHGNVVSDLIIKKVTINVDYVMKEDSWRDQRKLAGKRRYIAVYNRKREDLYLEDLNDKIDIVKRKISEIKDQKELKKSLGKMKSLVKFTKNGTVVNDKGSTSGYISWKRLQGATSLSQIPISRKRKLYLPTRSSGRFNDP